MDELLTVRVTEIRKLTGRTVAVELAPREGQALPPFTAGAHVDIHLPNGLIRSYSLVNPDGVNPDAERPVYVVAVGRDEKSRGGSTYVHDALKPGDILPISRPVNHFPLDEKAPLSVFIAGGIGITPILAMVYRAQCLGASWELYYCARSKLEAAFLDKLTLLSKEQPNRLHLHFDDEHNGRAIDLNSAVKDVPEAAHIYCCGPAPMLAAFEKATADLDPARVHVEHFTGSGDVAVEGGFTVELAKSRLTLTVKPGNTILDTLLEAGVDIAYSCAEGICGSCETRVISGTPDHRDLVLSDAEREANETMMICCSGSVGPRLVLDR